LQKFGGRFEVNKVVTHCCFLYSKFIAKTSQLCAGSIWCQRIVRLLFSLIKCFYKQAGDNLIWSMTNIVQLVKYVKLDEVYKMCACYFASKSDPQVLCLQEAEHSLASTPGKDLEEDDEDVDVMPDLARKT